MSAGVEIGACYRNPWGGEVVRALECLGRRWRVIVVVSVWSDRPVGSEGARGLNGWERVPDPTPVVVDTAVHDAVRDHNPEPMRSTAAIPVSRVQVLKERVFPLARVRGIEIDEAKSPYTLVVRVTFCICTDYICTDDSALTVVVRSESLDEAFTRAEQILRDAFEAKP